MEGALPPPFGLPRDIYGKMNDVHDPLGLVRHRRGAVQAGKPMAVKGEAPIRRLGRAACRIGVTRPFIFPQISPPEAPAVAPGGRADLDARRAGD